jgi:hypothetical protein
MISLEIIIKMAEFVARMKRKAPKLTVDQMEDGMELSILIMIFITCVLAIAPIV